MRAGLLRHEITLDQPTNVPDNEGGFTQAWAPLSPPTVRAEIRPATAHDLERVVANTVQSQATHVMTLRYHAGVTTQTRVTRGPRNADGTLAAGSREFQVTGVQNLDERGLTTLLACREVVA